MIIINGTFRRLRVDGIGGIGGCRRTWGESAVQEMDGELAHARKLNGQAAYVAPTWRASGTGALVTWPNEGRGMA
eukprot:8689646-Pyramimonas_sp.AAC.1